MWESMRCVACGSHGLKITPTSLFAAPIHTSDRLSSSQMRMWWRMRTLGPGSSYARSCGRPSKYCVLTGALMAGRLAIAAVTSLVTATSDGFWACTQPALRKALSISLAVPSSSTLRGSPSAVPPRFSVRGTKAGSVGSSTSSRRWVTGSQKPSCGTASESVNRMPPISPARMRTGGPRCTSE